jgi:farnesyl-diphosphate farnesyltransferase
MAFSPNQLLSSLLRDVSRSFYLTLRVLPARIRPQIGLAYLLARTTDTIADTGLVPLEQRLAALQALRERILGRRQEPVDFAELSRHQGSPAERILLEQCEASLSLLPSLSSPDCQRVQQVLDTITSGQELDLRRFAGASAEQVVALSTDAELDDYTYRVAGCVGEFWTKMCLAHLFAGTALDEVLLLRNGVRFGKGLQLVNILRDLPADLRQGRCYLPTEGLAACHIEPRELLEPSAEPRLRPLYNAWLDRAQAHLQAGWAYTNLLPRRCVRVRLACAWPLLLGFETLKLLRAGTVLDPRQRIKVSRRQLKGIIARSVLYYPWAGAWRRLAPVENPQPEAPKLSY